MSALVANAPTVASETLDIKLPVYGGLLRAPNRSLLTIVSNAMGKEVLLQTSDNRKFKGVFAGCSPDMNIGLTKVAEVPNDNENSPPPLCTETFEKMEFCFPDIQCLTIELSDEKASRIVDEKSAARGFATDRDYHAGGEEAAQITDDAHFEEWVADEEDLVELEDSRSTTNKLKSGGWSIDQMFAANRQLGVKTDFQENLKQYTNADIVPVSKERMKEVQDVVRSIKNSAESRLYERLENDDDERDLDKAQLTAEVAASSVLADPVKEPRSNDVAQKPSRVSKRPVPLVTSLVIERSSARSLRGSGGHSQPPMLSSPVGQQQQQQQRSKQPTTPVEQKSVPGNKQATPKQKQQGGGGNKTQTIGSTKKEGSGKKAAVSSDVAKKDPAANKQKTPPATPSFAFNPNAESFVPSSQREGDFLGGPAMMTTTTTMIPAPVGHPYPLMDIALPTLNQHHGGPPPPLLGAPINHHHHQPYPYHHNQPMQPPPLLATQTAPMLMGYAPPPPHMQNHHHQQPHFVPSPYVVFRQAHQQQPPSLVHHQQPPLYQLPTMPHHFQQAPAYMVFPPLGQGQQQPQPQPQQQQQQ